MNKRIAVSLIGVLLALALPGIAAVKTENEGEDWRWESVERVVVVADIHGAYPELVGLLQATDVIDESLAWAGGKTHLVSLGDLLDRGAESRSVMDLLMRLQDEAAAAGGRVHVVLGNHEHMNLIGDLRYVSNSEYAAFADEEASQDRTRARERFVAEKPDMDAEALEAAFAQRFPAGYFGHRAAFRPGGRYGRWLLSLPTMVVVNDSVFVHGGLPELTSEFPPARLNQSFSADLSRYLIVWRRLVDAGILPEDEPELALELGQNGFLEDPSACVEERAISCEKIEGSDEIEALVTEFGELSTALVNRNENPFWYRGSVYCRDILERPILDAYLKSLGVSRLIVGHTPTEDSKVHVIRDGRVVMADTGMLVSYYKGRPAALVLEQDDKMLVQYLNPVERIAPAIDGRPVTYGLSNSDIERALATGAIRSIERADDSKTWDVIIEHEGRSIRTLFYPTGRGHPDAMELAAHALDELLGTELVPPTVPRRIEETYGAMQLVYQHSVSEQQRQEQGLSFSGWCPIDTQIQLMYTFDILTDNRARALDTVRYRRPSWSLHLVNHGAAFGKSRRLPGSLSDNLLKTPIGAVSALSRLDETTLQSELGAWLDKKRIAALLARRDALLKLVSTP